MERGGDACFHWGLFIIEVPHKESGYRGVCRILSCLSLGLLHSSGSQRFSSVCSTELGRETTRLVCPSSWNSLFFKEKSRCCGGGLWRPLRHTKWIYLSFAICTSQVNAVNLWTCERVIYDGWFWLIFCNISSDWGRAVSCPKECDILLWTEKLSCEVLVKFCLWRHVCG